MKSLKEIDVQIENLYVYYNHQTCMINEDRFLELGFDENGNHKCLENKMYYYLHDSASETMFPNIVSNEEYDDVDGVEVYHGFENIEYAYHYLNTHNKRHYGVGIQGNGFYTTTSKSEAVCYTAGKDGDMSEDKVLTMKINPLLIVERDDMEKAKVYLESGNVDNFQYINLDAEDKQKLEFIFEKVESFNDKKFKNYILSNISNIALLLGYHAIHAKRMGKTDDHLIVLEPSKLFVSECEAKRIEDLVELSEKD